MPRLVASAEAVASVPGCFTDVPALLEEGGLDVRSASVRVGSVMAEATAKDLAFLWSQHFTGGWVGSGAASGHHHEFDRDCC
eukprot:COSAG02_NODE_4127_length_5741_cov_9.660936_1_plen_82_part_00